jgi:phospholipid-binding lipoprotein MlaA
MLPVTFASAVRRVVAGLPGILLVGLLAACGPAALPPGDSIVDADEAQNRAAHDLNLTLDRSVLRPVSRGYGGAVPPPVRRGVGNFASNLSQPSYVLNNLLQFRLGDATQNTLRFVVNTTIGLGGVLDPASAIGLTAQETDFGETLHIYGVPEGDFVMLPVFGPSTTRDTVGLVVDMATNPVRHVLPDPEGHYVAAAGMLDRFGDRYDMDDTIDSVLYESADSYIVLRSLYLQNRRFQLGGPVLGYDATAPGGDISADPYADPYSDPYADPYIDAYAP